MSMHTSKVSFALTQRSSSIFRYCAPKAYYSTASDHPGSQNENQNPSELKNKRGLRSNINIMKQMKDPIDRSKKLITDLETLLLTHEYYQAIDLMRFRNTLTEINKLEPQRDTYYKKLGLQKEDKKESTQR